MFIAKRPKIDERHFVVMGRPQAKQRPRMFRGVAYTPQPTRDYEARIKASYLDLHRDKAPFEGDVSVQVLIYFSKRNHGDLDNYVKTLDGLNAVAWKDDKQVKEIHAFLYISKTEPERMEVTIRPLEVGS